MRDNELTIRPAERGDTALILELIRELADYENLLHEVTATTSILETWLFDKQRAEVLIAEYGGAPVGYALFFHNFSTFLGKSGIYVEDIYVRPDYRGRGFGKALFRALARITAERGCGRLEWSCLDWNAPSIGFYTSLGAETMSEWSQYRLSGTALEDFAKG